MISNKMLLKLIAFGMAVFLARPVRAVELNEPGDAIHGYPVLYDLSGKKLASGEFRQWLEGKHLHVVISYKFPDGRSWEENALFRQETEIVQEKWSWKESNDGKIQREFEANFVEGTARAHIPGQGVDFSDKIEIVSGRTFVGFGFAIALSNLHDRLAKGEKIELIAVGFTPKPRLVKVNVSYAGLDQITLGNHTFRGDNFVFHPELPMLVKWFVHAPDHHIWLTNPAPATFLRWEGPIVLPSDPIIRVDFAAAE